jgi:FtsH-binding integral membrane protein
MQTILEGLSLGIVVTYFDVDLVLKAFVITTAVFIGLTAYTMQSKYDFSTWGARYKVWNTCIQLSLDRNSSYIKLES